MGSGASDRKKVTVFYDGACPMCKALTNKLEKSQQKNAFEIIDANTAILPSNINKEAALKEIHARDSHGNIYKNAGAIFKILEVYPRYRTLAKIGNLPITRPLFRIAYRFIAANRFYIFGNASRIYWTKIALVVGMIAGFLLSTKLWVSSRLYPTAPVSPLLPVVVFPFDYLFFAILIGILVAILLTPKSRLLIISFVSMAALWSFWDQSRWQPWFYQYLFMLWVLSFFPWKKSGGRNQSAVLNTCRIIVASIYFWSGAQKLNLAFWGITFPWIIDPFVSLLPASLKIIPYSLGIYVPILEAVIGVGLVTRRYRKAATFAAITVHLFILLAIGPLGHNWNTVVWPWNIVMILLVLILFWKSRTPLREIFEMRKYSFQIIAFIAFGVLPFFSFFGVWDSYLSSALYSGNTRQAIITMDKSTAMSLPTEIQQNMTIENESSTLSIATWSFDELNVPPYPENRIYRNVARDICARTNNSPDVELVTYKIYNPTVERYSCSGI